jgi:hypothetical protein
MGALTTFAYKLLITIAENRIATSGLRGQLALSRPFGQYKEIRER